MEENPDVKVEDNPKKYGALKTLVILFLALFVGYIHYIHVSQVFENHKNFSDLSDLERDMSFASETGFYYSYYKTMVEEKQFLQGITKLMYDRLVEYPKEVNAFNKFNIYQEVIIASIYMYFEPVLNISTYKQCDIVTRKDWSPVQSCIGIGHPPIFYLEALWWLAGLTVAALFLHATVLSGCIAGGLLSVLQYFANHVECTRVQWMPNERENFVVPFLLMQMCLLSVQLRDKEKRTIHMQISIFILNCICLLFWQFTQFIFLTQTAIFFVMEQLRIIDLKALSIFLHSHFCGLHMAILLLQGNDLLKYSFFTCFFAVVSIYCLFFSTFRIKIENRTDLYVECFLTMLRISIVVCVSLYLKMVVVRDYLDEQDDSHIWDILLSKFTDYKTLHTLMYTCSDVFDFLPMSTVVSYAKTMLLPFVGLSIINICIYWIKEGIDKSKSKNKEVKEKEKEIPDVNETEKEGDSKTVDNDSDTDDSGIENSENRTTNKKINDNNTTDLDVIDKNIKDNVEVDGFIRFVRNLKVEPAIFYNVSQMVVFGGMAYLIMRLKLLLGMQMCVVASLIMNPTYYVLPKSVKRFLPAFWVACVGSILYTTFHNMMDELSFVGEYSDQSKEELMQWIISNTPSNAAFAGSLPIMATVMLAARRPVVQHPHYENKQARDRAYAIHKVYGRFPLSEIYEEMTKLKVTYLIVENSYCYGTSSRGCTFESMWESVTPAPTSSIPRACSILLRRSAPHFYPVFRNEHYTLHRVHDHSVEYMPRSFDT